MIMPSIFTEQLKKPRDFFSLTKPLPPHPHPPLKTPQTTIKTAPSF